MAQKIEPDEIESCGLVMPISSIDGCSEQHWSDVKNILTETVESAGLKANLVSYADDVGIIQKRIIQNLYDNPIVICDVSGKNPNVMFELGMRLAFDKPTIIIKDDKTAYSFDTSPIEHLEYPRDLRFTKIVEFRESLKEKVRATLKKSKEDPNYTAFLKHFGTFTVAKLDTKEVSKEDFIIEEIKELKKSIQRQYNLEKHSKYRHYGLNDNSQVVQAHYHDAKNFMLQYLRKLGISTPLSDSEASKIKKKVGQDLIEKTTPISGFMFSPVELESMLDDVLTEIPF